MNAPTLTATSALQIASDRYGWGGVQNIDAGDGAVLIDLARIIPDADDFRAVIGAPARTSTGRLYFPDVALSRAAKFYGWGGGVDPRDIGPITALAADSPSWASFDAALTAPARDAAGVLSFSPVPAIVATSSGGLVVAIVAALLLFL